MTAASIDVHAYGTYARHSAVADALEVAAIQGRTFGKPVLGDRLRDAQIVALLEEKFSIPSYLRPVRPDAADETDDGQESLAAAIDEANHAAESIFGLLAQRKEILGERYPFTVDHDGLRVAGDYRKRVYSVLLGITICHAYRVETSLPAWRHFESFVTDVLRQRGLLAENLAESRRGGADFIASLAAAGKGCGLRPTPEMASYRFDAHDEGADIIAHLDWSDTRAMHWVFVTQATCAKSDDWLGKLTQPGSGTWRDLLGLMVAPRVILAVPHHVEDGHLIALLRHQADGNPMVLDRLRLAWPDTLPPNSEEFLDVLSDLELDFD